MNKFYQTLSIIIVGVAILIILIQLNVIIQYNFTTGTVNLNSILSQSIPALTGAFFSGLFAYLIYILTSISDKKKLVEQSNNSLLIIKQEIEENKQNVIILKQALSVCEPKIYSELLDKEKESSESPSFDNLIIIDSKFSTQIIDNLLTNLSSSDYLIIAKDLKYIKQIVKSMTLLTTKSIDIEARTILIENILTYSGKLENNKQNKKADNFLLNEAYFIDITIKLIIIFTIYSFLNILS